MSNDALQDSLDEAVISSLNSINPGVVTSWVLVAHQANFDDDGDGLSSYPVLMMNGSQPDHVVRGLIDVVRDHVRGVGKWAEDMGDEDD